LKTILVASMMSAAAYGSRMLPTTMPWLPVHDARAEAVITAGVLLALASLLRRNLIARWR
jgi:hypothetical protein